MADHSKIEWTDATWTPIKGCTRVSPGCGGPGRVGGCYAEIMAARFSKAGQWGEGLAEIVTLPDGSKDHRWTGVVRFDENELLKPLKWKTPRLIFVCSTADLFHEKAEDEWIDRVFAVMALCPQHTFQVLTKRPERMRAYVTEQAHGSRFVLDHIFDLLPDINDPRRAAGRRINGTPFRASPLPNVWLGTSTEDQQRADERIPHLLATPAAVLFISAEPLLGPIDLTRVRRFAVAPKEYVNAVAGRFWTDQTGLPNPDPDWAYPGMPFSDGGRGLDWVIAGGESGPGARPMHPDWARSLRDQCAAAGVPFFFKQWGAWRPNSVTLVGDRSVDGSDLVSVSKKDAGRTLDGQQHDGMPV